MFLFLLAPALAQQPPVVTDVHRAQAMQVQHLGDSSVVERFRQLLSGRELDDGALFALAETHPGLAEQLASPDYALAIEYINALPPPIIHKLRQGELVVRTAMTSTERGVAERMATHFRLKPKKLLAVRIGPKEGRIYTIEVNSKKGSAGFELAWPSTPERDEASRDRLSKVFGARPSISAKTSRALPMDNPSFEAGLDGWKQENGTNLGAPTPIGRVMVDSVAIDGQSSVRFYADRHTRQFPVLTQRILVVPGMRIKATTQVKTDNIRAEYHQRPGDLFLMLSFEDLSGREIGEPTWSRGNMATHPWQVLEVTAQAPPECTTVRVALGSALSGTAWFDAVTVELD